MRWAGVEVKVDVLEVEEKVEVGWVGWWWMGEIRSGDEGGGGSARE